MVTFRRSATRTYPCVRYSKFVSCYGIYLIPCYCILGIVLKSLPRFLLQRFPTPASKCAAILGQAASYRANRRNRGRSEDAEDTLATHAPHMFGDTQTNIGRRNSILDASHHLLKRSVTCYRSFLFSRPVGHWRIDRDFVQRMPHIAFRQIPSAETFSMTLLL